MLTQIDRLHRLDYASEFLLQDVLDHLLDGVLILTAKGDVVYRNEAARRISQQFDQETPDAVPLKIWRLCEALIESLSLYANQRVMVESEIAVGKPHLVRVRVRWLPLQEADRPYLVVLLEDCCQALQGRAIAEIQQYGLTPRQAEVWLLHRLGYTYQEIAAKLYISFNTVKKHIKDIHLKQPVEGAEV
jgi:DNA-binding CsgD family transcriptional regulator